MTEPSDPVAWYSGNAAAVAAAYEALDPAELHAWLQGLPAAPALVDVGAGTGRDAAWLTRLGHDVVAAEPVAAMRAEAERRHAGTGVRWVEDLLPALPATHRLGLSFDVVLLSGVWQHVAPGERELALLHAGEALYLRMEPAAAGWCHPRHEPSP